MWGITKRIALLALLLTPLTGQAMTVAPEAFDLDARTDVDDAVVSVFNDASATQTYDVSLIAVEIDETSGELLFGGLSPTQQELLQVSTDQLVVASGETAEVIVSVRSNEEEPFMTFAVLVQRAAQEEGIAVSPGVASIGFVTFADEEEQVTLISSDLEKTLATQLPIETYLTVRNEGSNYVPLIGELKARSWTGKETIIHEGEWGRLVPEQARTFDALWGEDRHTAWWRVWHEWTPVMIGPHQLVWTVASEDVFLQSSKTMWFLPVRTLCLLTGLMLIVIYLKRRV